MTSIPGGAKVRHKQTGATFTVKKDYGGVLSVFGPPYKMFPHGTHNVYAIRTENLEIIDEPI